MPSYDLRDDQNEEVNALPERQALDAHDIYRVDGGAQAWIRRELKGVDRVRNYEYFLRWDKGTQG